MKLHRIVCVCAAIVLPQVSLAGLPFTGQALATAQATIDFCAQVHPEQAKKYQEHAKLLVRDSSEEEVAKLRKTSEYKEAYEWVTGELAKVTRDESTTACRGLLPSDN